MYYRQRCVRQSGFVALRDMGGPSLALFRLDLGEAGAGGRIGDADEMVAGWTLNLPARELWFALQRLVAVGTIKFEIARVHVFIHHAQTGCQMYMKYLFIL